MVKIKLKTILLVACWLASFWAQGQDVYPKRDSLRHDGLRIGAELLWPIYYASKPDQKHFELMADYSLNRHILVAEVGQQYKQSTLGQTGKLEVNGVYMRIGYEYNLLRNGDDVLFVGGRISQAIYQRKVKDLLVTNDYWGQGSISVPEKTGSSQWLEVVAGLKARLVSELYAGFTARIGYRIDKGDFGNIPPNIIPGFGDAKNTFNYNFSYYLSFKLPTRTRQFNTPPPKKR